MQNLDESQVTISKAMFVPLKTNPIEEDYEIGEEYGKGTISTILKATKRSTGQVRAIKKIKKTKETNNTNLELEILKKMIHPNIMEVYEAYEDSKYFYIVAEFCQGVELYNLVIKEKCSSEGEAASLIKQVLSALNYCHLNQVVHRDIRPENILVDSKRNVKIIEWNTARYFQPNKFMCAAKSIGYYYLSPEVIEGVYNEKCDIWATGVILYILLCGYPPFNGDTKEQIIDKIKIGKFTFPDEEWGGISDEAKSLIRGMLTYEVDARFDASTCLSHPWLKERCLAYEDKALSQSIVSNMKKLHVERKLQQAALIFMVNHLVTNEDKNGLVMAFQKYDVNGDGVISKEELYEVLRNTLGEKEAQKEIDKTMKKVDVDSNGYIDYNEFVIASLDRKKLLIKDKLEATFKMFDLDGDGSISTEELQVIIGKTLEKESTLKCLIKDVDLDGDENVSFNEFKLLMSKLVC